MLGAIVSLLAVLAAAYAVTQVGGLITLVFVPLELRENVLRRRHRIGEDEEK